MILFVDGKSCPTKEITSLPIDFSIEGMSKPQSARQGVQIELTIPSTTESNAIFGSVRDIYSATRFNATHHQARLECDGVVMFEGTIYLLDSSMDDRFTGDYRVRVVCGGKQWAKDAARTELKSCGIPFRMELLPENIMATWEGFKPVRFLPVFRNRYSALYSEESLAPLEHIMTTDDYHPFFSVAALFEKIFEDYTVEGDFWNSSEFRQLLFSGQYASPDTLRQRSLLNFCAGRKATATAVADDYGKVYATASFSGDYSLGNIVDTANPTAVNSKGELMQHTFNTGNVFGIDDEGYCRFESSMAANVGFILHLEYKTDYRIGSRKSLKAFNRVLIGDNVDVLFEVTNGFKDQRNNLVSGITYNLCIFDYIPDMLYMLKIKDKVSGEVLETKTIDGDFVSVTMPAGESFECILEQMTGEKLPDDFDWAMYNGYVQKSGQTDIVVDIRIPPREFSAGEKMRFNNIRIAGADPGMGIELSTACMIKPYFSTVPGYGSKVSIADIAHNKIWLIEVVEAICQMFNLLIFTDESQKKVIIEPMENFYTDKVWDWSDKIDRDSPIRIADIGVDYPHWVKRKYIDADYASTRYNKESATEIGCWKVENPTYGALDTSRVFENPLFTTGINRTGVYALAPSASILQVGDNAAEGGIDSPFTAHIVRYMGLKELPEGEVWGYPLSESRYPLAAFFYGGDERTEGFSLCFEDRDGVEGLHRYFDAQAERTASRQRLTLTLLLKAVEVEQLLSFDYQSPSVRDTFRLDILGESSLYRLESLKSYNPATKSAECTFIRLTKD